MAASIIPCTYTFPSPYTYGGQKRQKKFLKQQFKEHLTVAPPVGLEPTTLRLTAACSTD